MPIDQLSGTKDGYASRVLLSSNDNALRIGALHTAGYYPSYSGN
jgi:hypothetical protein